ncbi:MAG: glycosyltransferase, partial [Proteobacteria bacterium]|nr:glycosyltransferase [Pseudomonadota bacterium]
MTDRIRYRLRRPGDPASANAQILEIAAKEQFDVIWLDRAVTIKGQTLAAVRTMSPATQIVWYAEDDMMNPVHRTRWVESAIPHIDLWVTTKSFNAQPDEVPSLGVRRVMFVNNAYDPRLHVPARISEEERSAYSADVGFVGTYEKPRADSLVFLAGNSITVRVWGNGWGRLKNAHDNLLIEDRPVYDEEYGKVVAATAINLCFLRKGNRDLQTCRSIELPAFGAFMLHERNSEICALFREDREAAYFESDSELLSQCQRWLADEKGRDTVAGS